MSFTRIFAGIPFDPKFEPVRRSVGYALRLAQGLNLNKCQPMNELSTTGYCLAIPGQQYLIYQPDAKAKFDVQLRKNQYNVEWFDPSTGLEVSSQRIVAGEQPIAFTNPLDSDAVLYIYLSP